MMPQYPLIRRTGFALAVAASLAARGDARFDGTAWTMSNGALTVRVEADSARLTVVDHAAGIEWAQEDPRNRQAAEKTWPIRRCTAPPAIDGDGSDWPGKDWLWLPWVGKDGERNLSGGAQVLWDDQFLYLYVRMRDDVVAFGRESAEQWWEADSVEFWVDGVQVGLHLYPGKEAAVDPRGAPFAGSRVGVKLIPSDPLPGYGVEAAIPLTHFPVLRDPSPGIRFHFAIGENDADPGPGEPVRRVAQGYLPATWVHSTPATFGVAVLTDADGNAPPLSRENDRTAGAAGGTIANVRQGSSPNAVAYDLLLTRGQAEPLALSVEISLPDETPALEVAIRCPGGDQTPMKAFQHPPALYPPAPETYFMAMADYCDGRYLPVGDPRFRNRRLAVFGGDMPWVAVTDGRKGLVAIALTPADSFIQMQSRLGDEARLGFPGFGWEPSQGRFGGERRGRLSFYDRGGHVRACKIYREIARQQGLLRTLGEKARANPDVLKLLGAVNWWGANGLGFVREAVGAGMTHGLANGRWSPEAMAEMVRLGWLAGEYDNYVDIDDAPAIAYAKAPVAEHAVILPDGTMMTAWVHRDENMQPIHTYMKHCTARQLECAKALIPEVLRKYPYNARFLDVTPAENPIECYSPSHPTTRSTDIANRQALCRYVSEELRLVTGGEHGRYWSVPFLHYHEGMMGGGFYSWPAGYLRDPKDRSEISPEYLEYGINPANRAPLFELVFHDCVVNYWYWGATNDYLHQVMPELTDRKTAMNILYGTPPMMWAHSHGLRWQVPEEREQMLTIYRNVCKLHEVVGPQEMVEHRFLSGDRLVQQTRFADGTTCTVNFGTDPFAVSMPESGQGASGELRQNDFHVYGPRIEQWRFTAPDGASRKTFIRTDTFLFAESGREPITTRGAQVAGQATVLAESPARARVLLGKGATLALDVPAWQPGLARRPRVLLALGPDGRPAARVPGGDAGPLTLAAPPDAGSAFLLLTGDEADVPDVTLEELSLTAAGRAVTSASRLAPDDRLDIACRVCNLGLAAARQFEVVFRLDGPAGPVLHRERVRRLGAGDARPLRTSLKAAAADGPRRVLACVESQETLTLTGRLEARAEFTGPCVPGVFVTVAEFSLTPPAGDSAGMPVELPLQLTAGGASGVNTGNLRVRFEGGAVVPAQFEPAGPAGTEGTLVFCLPPGLEPGTVTRGAVLGVPAGSRAVFPHTSGFDVAEDGSRLRLAAYSVSFAQGNPTDIAVRTAAETDLPVVDRIVVSARETGWTQENGTLETFACLHRGPVRAVFTATKVLASGHRVTRTCRFYADRMEVETHCEPRLGSLTRTFFLRDATAVNETGRSAAMDGKGDGEGFGFQGRPSWYAVFSPEFRCVCLALTPPGGFVWWDSGLRGQASIDHAAEGPERRLFVWGPGADDDRFARAIAQACAQGVTVTVSGGR